MTAPISDERLAEIRAGLEGGLFIKNAKSTTVIPASMIAALLDEIERARAVLSRLDKAEATLGRISRWERYGGEDSEPLVYPKDIALAYFNPPPSSES